MAKFWDDLNSALGYPPKASDSAWSALEQETGAPSMIDGLNPISPAPVTPTDQSRSPFYQSTEDVNTLVSLNPQPFTTVDVNPPDFAVTLSNKCVIDQGILRKLFGPDGGSNNVVDFANGPWRTVEVNVPGTFLKFQFRNAGRNAIVSAGGNPSAKQIGSYFPYLSGNGSNEGNFLQNSERNVVIQFGATNAPPMIVRDGDAFRCPFTTVYISFKTFCAPFRVSIGQKNAEIISPDTHRLMNSNIAFGPGYGLWENSPFHAVPFCFSHDNFQNTGFTSAVSLAGAGQIFYNLITNDPSVASSLGVTCPTGTAIFWITEIIFGSNANSATSEPIVNFILNVTNSGGLIRTIYEFSLINNEGTTTTFPTDRVYLAPPHPTRMSLRQGETLSLMLKEVNGSAATCSWMVKGYIVGGLTATQSSQNYNAGQQSIRSKLSTGISGVGMFPTVCFDSEAFPDDPTFGP